ncbi:MAG: hypothetical protein E3J86_14125 [Candidatus Thorarchaeota archaeon]|nr:MAG: hypothetical protein E3J86_14125 [Candidatus Thorarchaeota archaeon]
MNDDELNDIRQLIDLMQSSLVELFDQLRELRERLHLVTGLPADMPPSIVPLFSDVKPLNDTVESESSSDLLKEDIPDTNNHSEPTLQEISDTTEKESHIPDPSDSSSSNAKVSRVLDPIARELRTGEATADIILEYLQAAKEYLIDDDERKKKVARDMDIVLNFLTARGKRGIRTDERDNILKRIRRWKAHLVSYSGSPAE